MSEITAGNSLIKNLDVQVSNDAKEMSEILSRVKFKPEKGGLNIGLEGYTISSFYGNAEDIRKIIRNLPRYGKRIQFIDVMKFPFIRLSTEFTKQSRSYSSEAFGVDDRPDLLTLNSKRSMYKDPWTDGVFPKHGDGAFSVELTDTCEIVKCDKCGGRGYTLSYHEVEKSRHSIKCPRCLGSGLENGKRCGRCKGDGWIYEVETGTSSTREQCKQCYGSGKRKQVLKATQSDKTTEFYECGIWMCDGWKTNVPNVDDSSFKLENNICSSALNYKTLVDVKSEDGRVNFSELDLSNLPVSQSEIQRSLDEYWENAVCHNQSSGTYDKIITDRVRVEYGVRFARIHLKLYVSDEIPRGFSGDKDRVRQVARSSAYWSDPKAMLRDVYVWVDVVKGELWDVQWVGHHLSVGYRYFPLIAVILRIGDSMDLISYLTSSNSSTSSASKAASNKAVGTRNKKRWKFITLGLLFGWMGAHYFYARRMFLLLLLWASFITGVAMIGSSQGDEKQPSQDVTSQGAKESNTSEAIGGGCIALWALLWLGGTFFVKKDGKGNRM